MKKYIKSSPSYDLRPMYDSRQSFYSKARVDDDKDSTKLYSYNTLICTIDKRNDTITFTDAYNYSQTTRRHLREFLRQNGVSINLKDIVPGESYDIADGVLASTKIYSATEEDIDEFADGIDNLNDDFDYIVDGLEKLNRDSATGRNDALVIIESLSNALQSAISSIADKVVNTEE